MRLHRLFRTLTFFACALLPLACGKPNAPPIGDPSDTAEAAEVADASGADADVADTTSQDVPDAAAVKDTVGDGVSTADQVDVDDGDTQKGETVLPDIEVDVDTEEVAEGETSADADATTDGDADTSVFAACDVDIPDAVTISEGDPCDQVGASLCADFPRTMQAGISIYSLSGESKCLPSDRMVCVEANGSKSWTRISCNELGKSNSCLGLPKGAAQQSTWSAMQSGSGCRPAGLDTVCCPAALHAAEYSGETMVAFACPASEAGKRICHPNGTHIVECRAMPDLAAPEPFSLAPSSWQAGDYSALASCAASLVGCSYALTWYRDPLQGKLYCDLPNTIPPKKVSIVPRCIMDNGQARWAKTCDEHFNGVPAP